MSEPANVHGVVVPMNVQIDMAGVPALYANLAQGIILSGSQVFLDFALVDPRTIVELNSTISRSSTPPESVNITALGIARIAMGRAEAENFIKEFQKLIESTGSATQALGTP